MRQTPYSTERSQLLFIKRVFSLSWPFAFRVLTKPSFTDTVRGFFKTITC